MTVAVWTGVVLLGGVGAVLRFLVDRAVSGRLGRPFPIGTLAINLRGATLLGFPRRPGAESPRHAARRHRDGG